MVVRSELGQDLESEILKHLEQAGKIANQELEHDLSFENVQTKSWHVKKAAEAAEMAGWIKIEIAKRLIEIIEKHDYNISRRLVYHVCSPLGYSLASEDSAMIAQPNSSLNTTTSFAKENAQEIEITDALISFLTNTVRPRLVEGPYIDRLLLTLEIENANVEVIQAKRTGDKTGIQAAETRLAALQSRSDRIRRQYEEDYFVRRQMLHDAREAWDNRHTVTIFEQHELLKRIEVHHVAGGVQAYKAWVKDISMTPKQAHKYKAGEVRELLPIYDPKNREEAIRVGFYGIQCNNLICKKCGTSSDPTSIRCSNEFANYDGTVGVCNSLHFEPCKSWRVKLDKGGASKLLLHCFACLGTFRPATLSLPRNAGTVIDEKMQKLFDKTYPQWKKENKID